MNANRPFHCALALAMSAAVMSACAQSPSTTATEPADDDAPAPTRKDRRADGAAIKWGIDPLQAEVLGWRDAPAADTAAMLRLRPYVSGRQGRAWEWRIGAHLEADAQSGGSASFDRHRIAFGDSYLRYRSGETRITAGAQTIVWGRVDAVPLIDRVSRVDLRRFAIDELTERRLPQWALRWEQGFGDLRLDMVWLPQMQPARLPDERSPWHPVDRQAAQIIGVPAAPPALAPFFRTARMTTSDEGSGGVALRMTRTGEPFDFGVTLAHTRQPLPYLRLDPVRGEIAAVHPYNRFVAVDAEVAGEKATWRTELALTADAPVTGTDGRPREARVLEWVGGVEFFPGGKGHRVTLQALARSVRTGADILELREYYALNGEAEASFDNGRWKTALRFAAGLNVRDSYVSPRISFVGWEPHEIYLAAHLFDGPRRSLIGFHRNHDALALGIKTRF